MIRQIKVADKGNLSSVSALLAEFSLPVDGIEDADFWMVESDKGELIGCVGLEVRERQGLLRSLAVKRKYQENGIGSMLVERLLSEARDKQISQIFLLTDSARTFFEKKFGFLSLSPEEKNSFQGPITKSKEFTDACPKSAVLMKKTIGSMGTIRIQ